MGRIVRALRTTCVVIALGLAACIQAGLVPCGDKLCPAGATCVADELCAQTDQIAACAGIVDGETCSVGGGTGRCDRGVCLGTGCGNEIVDVGEACDDGNTVNGDGCRGDCSKVEACGDARVDVGEGCDDGNQNTADGCDACVLTTWRATALIGGNANATTTELEYPYGVTMGRSGEIYIADALNHRIRRVDATGLITTVAGTGNSGRGGDGGPATSAQLYTPFGTAIDGLGNLYIADRNNHLVRRVDPTGVITTFAGNGNATYTGNGGPATSAGLATPSGVAVDGLGNVYIADLNNHCIRLVNLAGVITTFAGTGAAGFVGDGGLATAASLSSPNGVALDGLGNVYIADSNNHRIRRVNAAGIITTVAGTGQTGSVGDGGLATNAQLWIPVGVAIDPLGTLYIADSGNHKVRRVSTTGIITTAAGIGMSGPGGDGGLATVAQLNQPGGVAVDGIGNVYIADVYNHRIRRVDATGVITTVAGSGTSFSGGDGGAGTSAVLGSPTGITVDSLGNVYIADDASHRIRRVDPTGVITTFAGSGGAGVGGDGGLAIAAQLRAPSGVAADAVGNIYVADKGNHRIRRIAPSGVITTVAGTGVVGGGGDGGPAINAQLSSPFGVAVDGAGILYIADTNNQRIRRVDLAGVITTVAGTGTQGFSGDNGPATSAQLRGPSGIAVDILGNRYIADALNLRIRRVDPFGNITTFAGNGTSGIAGDGGPATSAQINIHYGVAVDVLGNVYIADTNNQRIRRVDTNGIIATVAGSNPNGGLFTGDGGLGPAADLCFPQGVAPDGLGGHYIADECNAVVRHVSAAGIITTSAGQIDPEGMGPFPQARLADPRGLVRTDPFTLVAGGSSGTLQIARTSSARLEVVAGRYPHLVGIAGSARFGNRSFGTVAGVAYDAASQLIFLTETNSNRLHVVTIVDLEDRETWTIAPLVNAAGTAGFADGAAATAKFRAPRGLYFDAAARQLYVADTGNHVIRAIDLSTGVASATVRTVAGTPVTRGFFGDGGAAIGALLYEPQAITRCTNGDLFIADTGNHRVRRVAAATNEISTVLGDGVAASSGEGSPSSAFPVNRPLGLVCDPTGNLFVTSTTTVRLVPANASGIVDGTGEARTIYGAQPRTTFPASVTSCLTGLAVVDATKVQVVDSCTGLLVELRREPGEPAP